MQSVLRIGFAPQFEASMSTIVQFGMRVHETNDKIVAIDVPTNVLVSNPRFAPIMTTDSTVDAAYITCAPKPTGTIETVEIDAGLFVDTVGELVVGIEILDASVHLAHTQISYSEWILV